MTEAEWLACDDPIRMLHLCRNARKLRLFACACYRQTGDFDEAAATTVEHMADGYGRPPYIDFMRVRRASSKESKWLWCVTCPDIAVGLRQTASSPNQAALLREVFGNPFQSAPELQLTATALAIARCIYEERDFGSLPILADALEDAGNSGELLSHLRRQHHVLGCWALDVTLASGAAPRTPGATAPSS